MEQNITAQSILDAWEINNRVCLELLDLCPDDAFELKPGKGKTIRSNFVHLVGVRKVWCEEKMAKEAKELPKLDWKAATREEIVEGLHRSNALMLAMLLKRLEATKPTRFSVVGFLAYAIAHEAHHRSQVEIALRINGREPDEMALYGLWEWSKKLDGTPPTD